MKAYIALGSNLGDPLSTLEGAAKALSCLPGGVRAAPIFRTKALVPEGAPDSWNREFSNSVVAIEWNRGPEELLAKLKSIESGMGREAAPRWAPRLIDLDLIALGDEILPSPSCTVPLAEACGRHRAVHPPEHIAPSLRFPGKGAETILSRSRSLAQAAPLWMGIFNLTPDSFSDGGTLASQDSIEARAESYERAGVQAFDLGAESTRPGACRVAPSEEWDRLSGALSFLAARYQGKVFRPWVSVDTRNAWVAAKALEAGAQIINDVSGCADPEMPDLLQSTDCQYILMHSISVPADRERTLAEAVDPIEALRIWMEERLEMLTKKGIDLDRIIFDPGIGFGKTAQQSLEILRRIQEFHVLPLRILAGHSRKSFMNAWGNRAPKERDGFSIGASLALARKRVDILRTHEAHLHAEAWQSHSDLSQ